MDVGARDRPREREVDLSDRRRSPAIPRSPVAAARTVHGANRAANALLLQAAPEISGFWCAWAQIVLTALLETVAAELTRAGRRRRHSELDVLDQLADSLLTDGTSALTTVLKLDSSERSPA